MNDSRPGETLWSEWLGEDYSLFSKGGIVYYTIDHVDIENEVVKRALASAFQRDGVADSLGEGYKLAESCIVTHGNVGFSEGEDEPTVCDEDGETYYGDEIDEVLDATWVEIDA